MTSVLITGFEPFTTGQGLVLNRNPTGEVARAVGEAVEACTGYVLPVSFRDTRSQLEELLHSMAPTYWIGMGFAPHRTTLDVEAIALNVEHAAHGDNDGECPNQRPIVDGAPVAYSSTMDLNWVMEIFQAAHLNPALSFHAGTYLCNQSLFTALHAGAVSGLPVGAFFLHVPPMDSFGPLTRALEGLVRALIRGEHPPMS